MPFMPITSNAEFKSLNEGQQVTALAAINGGNLLISGGGGVGKSHLIRFLSKFIPNLVLTASTGIAAINIAGQTLDSLMGFNKSIRTISQAKSMDEKTKKKLSLLSVLLVDEVSMVRSDRVDMMDARLKVAKKSKAPFGGVSVILVGDFCQLPPIVTNSLADKAYKKIYKNRLFAFEADCYKESCFTPYILNEYVRQGHEETRRNLRNMRMGHKLPEVVNFLNQNSKGRVTNQSLRICKTNKRVSDINKYAFSKLKGQAITAHGVVEGVFPSSALPADEKIALKQYCRVLLTVNKPDDGYLNGDLGELKGFRGGKLVVKLDRGPTVDVEPHEWANNAYDPDGDSLKPKEIGKFTQFPVRLGYAITGHKSQGMTLESAVVDFSGSFNAEGLAYVVFSRVKSLDNLKLAVPLTQKDVLCSKKARDFTFEISMQALARRQHDIDFFGLERHKMAA